MGALGDGEFQEAKRQVLGTAQPPPQPQVASDGGASSRDDFKIATLPSGGIQMHKQNDCQELSFQNSLLDVDVAMSTQENENDLEYSMETVDISL